MLSKSAVVGCVVVAMLAIAAPVEAQQRLFYAIGCDGTGSLLTLTPSGAVVDTWTLAAPPGGCATNGGGPITFTPEAIEALAFDETGRLWAVGDNTSQDDIEYLFELDPVTGAVIACEEMVLGAGYNVDDVAALSWWDSAGRLLGVDKQEQDRMFRFDPTNFSDLTISGNPLNDIGRVSGAAKFPDGGSIAYAVIDFNQINRVDCTGTCIDLGLFGVFFGQSIQYLSVLGLTAVPGGLLADGQDKLWALDDTGSAQRTLLKVDEGTANVEDEISITGVPAGLRLLGLTLDPCAQIETQPVGASVCEGDPVNLSAQASGWGTVSYQWRKDGGDLGGETGSACRSA